MCHLQTFSILTCHSHTFGHTEVRAGLSGLTFKRRFFLRRRSHAEEQSTYNSSHLQTLSITVPSILSLPLTHKHIVSKQTVLGTQWSIELLCQQQWVILLEIDLTQQCHPVIIQNSGFESRVSRSEMRIRSFSFQAPLLWKQLPVQAQEADALSTFKVRFNTSLFDEASSQGWVIEGTVGFVSVMLEGLDFI